jgi:hypothetical protein
MTHLRRHLREIPIEYGEMLEEPGHPVEAVYFPQTGMISLIVQMPAMGFVATTERHQGRGRARPHGHCG